MSLDISVDEKFPRTIAHTWKSQDLKFEWALKCNLELNKNKRESYEY